MTPSRFTVPSGRHLSIAVAFGYVIFELMIVRLQPVEVRRREVLIVAVGSIGVTLAWIAWQRATDSVGRQIRPQWFSYRSLVTLVLVGLLEISLFTIVNAFADRGPARTYTGIVTRVSCGRSGACYWDLVGAPHLPTATNTMRLQVGPFGPVFGSANEWDSTVLTVKPGFLASAWVSSFQVHRTATQNLPVVQMTRAAGAGNTAELRRLLASGVSIESVDSITIYDGQTALMAAAENGRDSSLAVLLASGADPNHGGARGETALMGAARVRDALGVRLLLKHGANPVTVALNSRYGPNATTALDLAIRAGDTAISRVIDSATPHPRPVTPVH